MWKLIEAGLNQTLDMPRILSSLKVAKLQCFEVTEMKTAHYTVVHQKPATVR